MIVASSAVSGLFSVPSGEQFSELYLLGSEHTAEQYPYNIVPNQDYTLYLNIGNHVGSLAYYRVYVKFLNASDDLPDSSLGKASPSQPVKEYRFLIMDEKTLETPITFAIANTHISNEQLIVGNVQLNGEDVQLNKVAAWNSTRSEYLYKLLFELWIYNNESTMFEFTNRFVYLPLNCTFAE